MPRVGFLPVLLIVLFVHPGICRAQVARDQMASEILRLRSVIDTNQANSPRVRNLLKKGIRSLDQAEAYLNFGSHYLSLTQLRNARWRSQIAAYLQGAEVRITNQGIAGFEKECERVHQTLVDQEKAWESESAVGRPAIVEAFMKVS